MDPIFAGIIPESLNEWRGKISIVAYFAGCNLRCPYCHASGMVLHPEKCDRIPIQHLQDEIRRKEGWIDGVVISGGEPTLNPLLPEAARRLKEQGVSVKVHTNGTNPVMVKRLIKEGLVDCVALDYKCPSLEKFRLLGGSRRQFEAVQETFSIVDASPLEREYHTTACPAIISEEDLLEMAIWLPQKGIWYIQKYNPDDVLDPEKAGPETYSYKDLEILSRKLGERRDLIEVIGVREEN